MEKCALSCASVSPCVSVCLSVCVCVWARGKEREKERLNNLNKTLMYHYCLPCLKYVRDKKISLDYFGQYVFSRQNLIEEYNFYFKNVPLFLYQQFKNVGVCSIWRETQRRFIYGHQLVPMQGLTGCCSAGGHDGLGPELLLLSSKTWFGCYTKCNKLLRLNMLIKS